MPGNPFEEMDREERKPERWSRERRPANKSSHAGLIAAIIGGALVVVVGLPLAFVVVCAGLAAVNTPQPRPGEKVWTRQEFENLVIGKKTDEVLKLVGQPEDTSKSGKTSMWTYRRRTRDTVTGKLDGSAFIHFDSDVATSVGFL